MALKTYLIGLSIVALAAGSAVAAEHMQRGPDADGNGTVSRTEARTRADAMFTRADVNKDGKLDTADRAARHAAHFDAMDTDKNGSISRSEFDAMHQNRMADNHEAGRQGMHHGAGHGAGHGPGHGNDDARGEGRHGRGRDDGHHGGMMMHMAAMADANKDGAVSKDEFLAAHDRHFDQVDANKDGQLTAEERRAARTAMRERMRQPGAGNAAQ